MRMQVTGTPSPFVFVAWRGKCAVLLVQGVQNVAA